jgi:AcrR family transcriptional regulator
MPKLFESREELKKTIVENAGRKLRETGFDGVGVDGLMREAGLTSGAFYTQFGSKKELLIEVLIDGFEKNSKLLDDAREKYGEDWLQKFMKQYLSLEHRSRIADGCLLPTLSTDAMRGGKDARQVFGEQIVDVVDRFSKPAPDDEKSVSRESFWALLALMAGGVMLARAVEDDETAEEILAACRRFAEERTPM